MPIHRQDFQATEHSVEEGQSYSWEVRRLVLQLHLRILQRVRGTTQDIQLGWRQFPWILPTIRRTFFWILVDAQSVESRKAIRKFQKYALYYGITTEFCRCNKSFVLANSETETFLESCIRSFSDKTHHVLPELMCLRWTACNYPILLAADAELDYCTWTGSKRS